MVGACKGTSYGMTPLDQGRLYRLNRAATMTQKKAGKRRKTSSNIITPPAELKVAMANHKHPWSFLPI
eukprot:scaffold3131_cov64-Attheya_sp.AAC.5